MPGSKAEPGPLFSLDGALSPAEVIDRLRALRAADQEEEKPMGKKMGVHKAIMPRHPTKSAKMRARMGLPAIPRVSTKGGVTGGKGSK